MVEDSMNRAVEDYMEEVDVAQDFVDKAVENPMNKDKSFMFGS